MFQKKEEEGEETTEEKREKSDKLEGKDKEVGSRGRRFVAWAKNNVDNWCFLVCNKHLHQ